MKEDSKSWKEVQTNLTIKLYIIKSIMKYASYEGGLKSS